MSSAGIRACDANIRVDADPPGSAVSYIYLCSLQNVFKSRGQSARNLSKSKVFGHLVLS